MAFKKRQLILLSLVAVICVAAFLNWKFNTTDNPLGLPDTEDSESTAKNLGEAKLVNGEGGVDVEVSAPVESDEYFTEARLNRQKTRDEALALLEEVTADKNNPEDIRKQAASDISQIAKSVETEGKIENLVKAKGFDDCVTVLSTDSIHVIVKTKGLVDSEVAQIKEIVLGQTELTGEQIKIVEIK
ncbi:SpoIIIAH-like family protein [Feifania hominis]|uniref:SpoIIIAH-like family protein n=1 Tax=Feifania hominis TaxID=2763660 RepID=A0A926DCY1_9FIRM|nr:SpoIIIAH-like family protein [Feifania hominis]MBC8535542.1 SpoIIIAH-like family protein [Feifania hominis]